MALIDGTNIGLVAAAPTEDPLGEGAQDIDTMSWAIKITTTDAITITELGWWCDNATQETNFEVGIYTHDAGGDLPDALLHVSRTNAKGTTLGWKSATGLSWSLAAATVYWIAHQVDDTATNTQSDWQTGGGRYSRMNSQTTLVDTWVSLAAGPYTVAIYAVYTTPSGTNMQINIGDAWKEVPAMQINIGDAWKEVASAQINIGDAWKTLF